MTHSSETSVKIPVDISCRTKKCLHLDAFLDTIIKFSHLEKKISFLDLFTKSKQRYSPLVMLFIFIDIESLCRLSKAKQKQCVDTEKSLCTQGISVSTQEVLTLCQSFQRN